MEGNKLFWKLGAFAKFDFKRFKTDADRLQICKRLESSGPSESLAQKVPPTSENITQSGKPKKKKKKKIRTDAQRAKMREEEMNHLRNKYHIHVHGADVPNILTQFSELNSNYEVSEKILHNITAQGYTEPTAIQRQAIPVMLRGRDIMACAPTGSGKTAAFIIPILHHLGSIVSPGTAVQKGCPKALVLAPTRELAKQTQREFRKLSKGLGLRIYFIEKEITAAKKCDRDMDILVTTPNRLVFLLKEKPSCLDLSSVQWLVVDESDRLFEAGTRGFRDQLGAIYRACSNSQLHRAMFSATFALDVEEWCKVNLDNVVQVYIGAKNTASSTVQQELFFTGDEDGKLIAFRNLARQGMSPPVLVFVQSKERAKHLYTELMYDNLRVDVIHADRPQAQRDQVVNNFRLGTTWVLICTELMGRGMDFKGVNLVINYDFPISAISYIHRVGRTGRANRQGRAVTFFTEADKPRLRSIASIIRRAGCPVPQYMLALRKPARREKKNLVQQVPERKSILTMDPKDYDAMRRKRKFSRQAKVSGKRRKKEIHNAANKPKAV